MLRLIRASFHASHGVYGAPRVFLDLREAGETCSKPRVARLMRENGLRALHGYRARRWSIPGPRRQATGGAGRAKALQEITTVSRPDHAPGVAGEGGPCDYNARGWHSGPGTASARM